MTYKDQNHRIIVRLEKAQKSDGKLEVFGVESHKYRIGRSVPEAEIGAFEEHYSLVLPGCYRSFLTEIGNGGPSYMRSAAGPFYGVYPLGESVDELLDHPELFFHKSSRLDPDMTDEDWAKLTKLTKRIDDVDEISDEDYEEELGKLYCGLLPIGSQGCTYLHALILNGPHQGICFWREGLEAALGPERRGGDS